MKDESKAKAQLLEELAELRRQVAGLEAAETEHRRMEDALRENEIRFRELYDHMSSGVAIYDVKNDGQDIIIEDINRSGERISQVKRGDIIGKDILQVFPGVKALGLFDVLKGVEDWRASTPGHLPIPGRAYLSLG